MTTEQEFFEAFFKPVYRFYYYEYDTDMISGHSDKTKCHKDFDIDKCKLSLETMQEIFEKEKEATVKFENGTIINCFKVEKYQPIFKITPEIVLGLIKIIADKGYSFKVFEAEDMFNNGIKYIANAITDIKHDIYGRGKTIDEAVISLCIQLKDEIQDQVKALFNAM